MSRLPISLLLRRARTLAGVALVAGLGLAGADAAQAQKAENVTGWVFSQLTDNAEEDSRPRVPGGSPIGAAGPPYVVWTAGYNLAGAGSLPSDAEILLYDGETLTQVTDNAIDESRPVVNNRGEMAWMGFGNEAQSEIFARDLGGDCRRLTNDPYPGRIDRYPDINDAGVVVWGRASGSSYRLAAHDLRIGLTTVAGSLYAYRPHVNAANHVVFLGNWIRYPDGTLIESGPAPEDYGYRLWRRSETNDFDQVLIEANPNATSEDEGPRDVVLWDGDTVRVLYQSPVWAGRGDLNRAGMAVFEGLGGLPGSTSGAADREIFAYDLNTDTITQLTDDDVDDLWPTVSEDGTVAWMGEGSYAGAASDDSDREIFLACPDADGDGLADNGGCPTQPGTRQAPPPTPVQLGLECPTNVFAANPRGCGIGIELVLLAPVASLFRRRRARSESAGETPTT